MKYPRPGVSTYGYVIRHLVVFVSFFEALHPGYSNIEFDGNCILKYRIAGRAMWGMYLNCSRKSFLTHGACCNFSDN